MKVHLQYGRDGIEVDIPSENVDVIDPKFIPGLPDESASFREAARNPIGGRPLRETIKSSDRVAIVTADITRPLPSERLFPWIFEELSHVPRKNITIINGTGSHRANTPEELDGMFGAGIARDYRIINHDAHDERTLVEVGKTGDGKTVKLNRDYVEADRRIVMGFIEPHFMAGFSGGFKGAFPAVAGIDSIMHYHRAAVLNDPKSTWGVLDGNPTQDQIRHAGSLVPIDFLVNVTLNRERQITGFFCGDTHEAHRKGCAFAKSTVMRPCEKPYPIVLTTNSGYPLDQNLYQAVKGMSAAAQIVSKGGTILQASRCNDGFPSHGNFRKLLFDHDTPKALLETVLASGFSMYDQWEAQLLANILLHAKVGLFSEIPDEEVRKAYMEPIGDLSLHTAREIEKLGKDDRIAVLPEGPLTIPYLTN